MTLLILEALWEVGSLNPSSAHAQPKPYDETKPSDQKAPDEEPKPIAKKPSGHTKITASAILSERYDSNVLFVPSGFDVGTTKWDFVTTLAPTVQVLDNSRYADTTVSAGVSGNVLINNPDLNFVATNVTGSVTLDKFVNQFVRGAKLQVTDSFGFSPEAPSFVSPAGPTPTDNPFARGLVPVRANMLMNTAIVTGAYPLTTALSIGGHYSYSVLRVGKIFVEQTTDLPVVFFNSDFHTWSLGPNWRLSRSDNLSVTYRSSIIDSTETPGGSTTFHFVTRGAEATYAKTAADWGVAMSGGATVFEGDRRVYATGMLTLSSKVGDTTNVRITGSRQVAPAFYETGGALISTTAGISVEERFSRTLSFTGSAVYAYNEVAPVNTATFESYTASALLTYKVTRSITSSLTYAYTYFSVDSGTTPQDSGSYAVNRQYVLFSVTARWN